MNHHSNAEDSEPIAFTSRQVAPRIQSADTLSNVRQEQDKSALAGEDQGDLGYTQTLVRHV